MHGGGGVGGIRNCLIFTTVHRSLFLSDSSHTLTMGKHLEKTIKNAPKTFSPKEDKKYDFHGTQMRVLDLYQWLAL